jgi:hypothetical protein
MTAPRKLNSPRAAITQWAASLDGADIPGGCDTCGPYQTVHVIDHGLINVRVHHDDWCPTLRRHQRNRPNQETGS